MCDFHSIAVRLDGAIAHVPGNSHSEAVKVAKWTENDSVHKAKRFVECEWNGEGDYKDADVVSRRVDGEELSAKQRAAIDRHYGALALALKGDLKALGYFQDLGSEYYDVVDAIIYKNPAPEVLTKILCDVPRLEKEIADTRDAAEKAGAGNIASGNYSKAASSGNSSKAASSGNSSTAASSGYYSTAASSGNSSTAASSGDSSTAASSGYYSTAASSGYYSKAASSGYSSTAASSGYYSTAASSGNSSTAASSGNYSKAASSGNSSTAASSGYYSTAASSGNSSTAASSGYYSKAASSGDYSKAASSGDYSKAEATGKNTVAMVAGLNGCARSGENGCFALVYDDKKAKRNRILVGYVGENGIKPDTLYRIDNGAFAEVQA